ncbi:hypothetical protein IAT38_002252 [Cryptococcus sp. DSM 104549]
MSVSSQSSGSSLIPGVPRVGAVRCYWALLKPRYAAHPDPVVREQRLELEFVHPDPILDVHLSKQKVSMMGRGVLEFIHPHEREQARRDLLSAINADDLQGSVTRVRFARLSRIRTLLGCPPEENEFPTDAETFVEDDEYLILDLVLNWVADGLLLAFFHSIKDKDPVGNNDPKRSHEEWSNWCGTRFMGEDQIEALHKNISYLIPVAKPTQHPPARVFQLHLYPPDDAPSPSTPPQLIFSWPPPRPVGAPPGPDGLYSAAEYCDMMKHIDMDPSQLTAGPGELRTNCTTRYGAHHLVTTEGLHRTVTSVFIPYGKLVFACFQTIKEYPLGSNGAAVYGPAGTAGQGPMPQGQQAAQAQVAGQGLGARGNAGPEDSPWTSSPLQHPAVSSTPPQGHSRPQPQPHQAQQSHSEAQGLHFASQQTMGWPPTDPSLLPQHGHHHQHQHHAHAHHDPAVAQDPWDPTAWHLPIPMTHPHHSIPHTTPPPPLPLGQHHQHGDLSQPAYPTPASAPPYAAYFGDYAVGGLGDANGAGAGVNAAQGSGQPASAPAGQPQRQQSTGINGGGLVNGNGSVNGVGSIAQAVAGPNAVVETAAPPVSNGNSRGSTRPLVRPPGDVECCVMCGIRESPEWRKNENGVKDLCNACGLRLARQVAKREGRQKPRKKVRADSSAPRSDGATKDAYGIAGN